MEDLPSVEQERITQIELSILGLGAHLEPQFNQGRDFNQSLANWRAVNSPSSKQRSDYVLAAYIPWWLYWRNTFWTVRFTFVRRRKPNLHSGVGTERLKQLEELCIRAELSQPVSAATARQIRQAIAAKKISHWHALSLLKSNACSVTAAGGIELHGASRTAVTFGVIIATLFVICIVMIAAVVIAEFDRDCMRHCILIAGVQLITLLAGFTQLTRLLTWERNRKQRFIAQVF